MAYFYISYLPAIFILLNDMNSVIVQNKNHLKILNRFASYISFSDFYDRIWQNFKI